jgi:2-polyprenyl-6-methoxyphenol hydroxylase-like FAD-dependent oxidoreductase
MPRRRALIVGGSLGGLFAAHLLRATGWEVEVYERIADDLASRGAGLGTHDALRDMMARIGMDSSRRSASPLTPTCAATIPGTPSTRSSSSG